MKPCLNKLLGYSYVGLQKKASITQLRFRKNLLAVLISLATMKLSSKDFLLVLINSLVQNDLQRDYYLGKYEPASITF